MIALIVNPRAGRGAVRRALPAIEAVLRDDGAHYTVSLTEAPGHARTLARDAIAAGARVVAAVGGDGTVHEVVNGMMGEVAPLAPDVALGIVASGTGCDTARTFGLPQEPAAAARHLLGDGTWGRLDVGRVRTTTQQRWFINIAEAGIGAQVVVSAARMPRWLGGRAYRLAALRGILTFKPRPARIEMYGRKARGVRVGTPLGPLTHEGTVTMVVVANCQFFGGGLKVAPRAIPEDGLLDVLVGEGTKRDAVRALRKMPNGAHLPSETIAEYLAERVSIETGGLQVEADGEPIGVTPAMFTVVRAALPLKI